MSKPGSRTKLDPEQPRGRDSVDAEVAQARVAVLVAGDEVAAHPEQHAVRGDPALGAGDSPRTWALRRGGGARRGNECGVLLSASDLMRFAGCAHATTLDLAWMRGTGTARVGDSEDAELLQRHGDAHEARHLARLKAAGRGVVEIVKVGVSLAQGVAATRAALMHGAEVVFQGALAGGAWGGWSDFLERVERPSVLGAWSYEVADTKLKRKPHPKHVLQLALYSDLLAAVQASTPHVDLGDGTRATIRLAEVSAYARRVRLEAFVAAPVPTRPIPCADCALCRWREVCAARLAEEDSLHRVANITRGQVAKLEAVGVGTMAALAARSEPVRGMAGETLARLVTQARLQAARTAGGPAFALWPAVAGKGLDLLPAPDPGDIFYDIEGDPHVEGGLEYLHGASGRSGRTTTTPSGRRWKRCSTPSGRGSRHIRGRGSITMPPTR